MATNRKFLRDFEASQYLDLLLISAVTTVLVIRFYLELTGYPQIGSEKLHIAHMLWGGLLMLAALIVLLSFLGRGAHRLAALLGGIGFGTFIDEVGKFVTADNDYFFQPAVSIMYVLFILTYLAIRSIHHHRIATSREYLVNALQEVGEVAVGDLEPKERERALRYLERCDPDEPLAPKLRQMLLDSELVPDPRQGLPGRWRDRLFTIYRRLATTVLFAKVLILFFTIQFLMKFIQVVILVFFESTGRTGLLNLPILTLQPWIQTKFSLTDWGQLATSLLTGAFVGLGVLTIHRDRFRALRLFQHSILVSLFLTQVFVFYNNEWAGLVRLAFNLLVLFALQFMIDQEEEWRVG